MRFAARTDGNHGQARTWLRSLCPVVYDASKAGRGLSDLVVKTVRGTVLLVEVKDPAQPPSKRKLRSGQQALAEQFGSSYQVVETFEDCVRVSRM